MHIIQNTHSCNRIVSRFSPILNFYEKHFTAHYNKALVFIIPKRCILMRYMRYTFTSIHFFKIFLLFLSKFIQVLNSRKIIEKFHFAYNRNFINFSAYPYLLHQKRKKFIEIEQLSQLIQTFSIYCSGGVNEIMVSDF